MVDKSIFMKINSKGGGVIGVGFFLRQIQCRSVVKIFLLIKRGSKYSTETKIFNQKLPVLWTRPPLIKNFLLRRVFGHTFNQRKFLQFCVIKSVSKYSTETKFFIQKLPVLCPRPPLNKKFRLRRVFGHTFNHTKLKSSFASSACRATTSRPLLLANSFKCV